MMKNDNRANRWVLNVTAFVILFPVLRYSLPTIQNITRGYIYQILNTHSHWLVLPVVVLTLALYVTGFILIVWKGRIRLAVLVTFLSFSITLFSVPILLLKGGNSVPRGLVIHENTPGIDVFCNDVYLGKTPLEMSEEEFHNKVKPWDSPPRQKMILGKESATENARLHHYGLADTELRRSYIPYDYFGNQRYFDQSRFYGDVSAFKSRYWWRFERDGCAAVSAIGNSAFAERQDGSLVSPQWWHPSLEYPAIRQYLSHLLHNLKRSNYQPSPEWRMHVAKASGLLFPHFYEVGERDSRVMKAFEMAIQTGFSINEEMSTDAWEAVLDEVISRSKRHHSFHTLSPESMAMDFIIQHHPKMIETHFLEMLSRTVDPWRVFSSGLNRSLTYGDPAEFLPLEYAVLRSQPPTLFKRLVYESGRGERFLGMVGNYSRPEALRLVRHYLDKGIGTRPSMYYGIHALPQEKALGFATYLQNSTLELELRRYVLQHAQLDTGGTDYHLREFIEARLARHLTGDDAISLAEWIAGAVPLDENEKLRFLIRIDSGRTHRYAEDILRRHPRYKVVVVEDLIQRPNRSLDRLLIDIYQVESAGVKFGETVPITTPRKNSSVSSNLIRAMALCDTPRMHAFLGGIWNASDRSKIDLLEAIKVEASRHFPHLHDWTTLISEIEDADTRLAAIPVLNQIDTLESAKVLAEWARSTDIAVKEEAEWALAKYHERSHKAEALLAGSIKPDDLLVGYTAYVWDGENYVPEETALGDK